MVSLIIPIEDKFKERLDFFPWVNWSEVAREESNKRRLFEEFIKHRKLSKEDEKFCEDIDWYPVDELPLKEEFVKKLEKARNEPMGKPMTLEEFNKWCDSI